MIRAVLAFAVCFSTIGSAQVIDAPARIILLVDSSSAMAPWTTSIRAGLTAFIDELPTVDEIGLVSSGSQYRVRVEPTTDRKVVRDAASGFFTDGGGNTFVDSLVEADRRLLRIEPDLWPVFVILTTDGGQTREDQNIVAFNQFTREFVARGGHAYVIVIAGNRTGVTTELAMNLARNSKGYFESMALTASLPARMRELAGFIYRDYHPKIR